MGRNIVQYRVHGTLQRIRSDDAHTESLGSRIDSFTLHLPHASSLPSCWTRWRGLRGIRSVLMANKAGGVERRAARDCRINWLQRGRTGNGGYTRIIIHPFDGELS